MSRRMCVFCGAQTGHDPAFMEVARETAVALVDAGYGLVYGGGRIGLMGVLADAVLEAGGEVTGVIPESLAIAEVAHSGLTSLHVVASMHERKALMAELSDGFIALPGGFGTMDEFCEILTWKQLGLHDKPIGLLNAVGYYDRLLELFDEMRNQGFVAARTRALFVESTTPAGLLERMAAAVRSAATS